MPTNWEMDKHIEAYPHNGILLSNEEKWTTNKCNSMNESHRYYVHWKRSDTKEYILHNFLSMMFKNRKNYSVVIDVRIVVNCLRSWQIRGMKEPPGVLKILYILIWGVITWVWSFVLNLQPVHLIFLYLTPCML